MNALALYYLAKDATVPAYAKAIVVGALAYFIMPFDAIPDWIPIIGYVDDAAALAAAVAAVKKHLRDEHWQKARAKLKEWF